MCIVTWLHLLMALQLPLFVLTSNLTPFFLFLQVFVEPAVKKGVPATVWLKDNQDGLRLMGMEIRKELELPDNCIGPLPPVLTPYEFIVWCLNNSQASNWLTRPSG